MGRFLRRSLRQTAVTRVFSVLDANPEPRQEMFFFWEARPLCHLAQGGAPCHLQASCRNPFTSSVTEALEELTDSFDAVSSGGLDDKEHVMCSRLHRLVPSLPHISHVRCTGTSASISLKLSWSPLSHGIQAPCLSRMPK